MFIRKVTYTAAEDPIAESFIKALRSTDGNAPDFARARIRDVFWPLPHLKPATEAQFWAQQSSTKAQVLITQIKIGDEWAKLHITFIDEMELTMGGFAVAIFDTFRSQRVEYYRWSACDHKFRGHQKGNCWWGYVCDDCGASYDIDSSG